MIGFCIPTIPERATMLSECIESLPFRGRVYAHERSPSCGEGWQAAGNRAYADGCDHIALLADDVLWDGESIPHFIIQALREKTLPAPYLIYPGGSGDPHLSTPYMHDPHDGRDVQNVPFPFLNRELWEAVQPIPPFGHHCDVWVTERAAAAGYRARLCSSYRLVHRIVTDEKPGEHDAYLRWATAHA